MNGLDGTDEQAISGLGLDDQRGKLHAEATRRGWDDAEVVTDDGYSAKTLARPGIGRILDAIERGDVLVAAKLDRLSCSLIDFAALMDRARREGWDLVVLDLGVDTSTAAGEMMANVMASFAQYERRLIGERTSAALQAKKSRGYRLGRPVELPADVCDRIARERKAGRSLRDIARRLTDDGVPTARGGDRWSHTTVATVLQSLALDAHAHQ